MTMEQAMRDLAWIEKALEQIKEDAQLSEQERMRVQLKLEATRQRVQRWIAVKRATEDRFRRMLNAFQYGARMDIEREFAAFFQCDLTPLSGKQSER